MAAAISEDTIQKTIVKPSWLNICPAKPLSSASGKNTTQVVTVEPIIEASTILVPSTAAS